MTHPFQNEWHVVSTGTPAEASLPPFVWLHGWGLSNGSLSKLAKLFSRDCHNRLYDLPGFGKTPMLAAGSGTRDYADQLVRELSKPHNTLAALTEPVVLVGHSFGARVAVQLAANYPDKVAGVILIAGAGLRRRRSLTWKVRALSLKSMSRTARWLDSLFGTELHMRFRNKFGSRDYKTAGKLRETFVRVINEDLVQEALNCRAPTLLLYGSEDTETPVDIGRRYEQLMPIARLEVLEGFGHNDILERGAYQVEAHIRRFMQDCELVKSSQTQNGSAQPSTPAHPHVVSKTGS